MATEVRVPTLGESVTEATVATWFKKPGDQVAVDDMLCELETDKVTVEVPSPVAGTLAEIVAAEGATVSTEALLAQINEGATASAPAKSAPAPAAQTTAVMVPVLGESVTEATVSTWYKKPGDTVTQDEMLCELETDKVSVEVPAPAAGVLGQILAAEGSTVQAGGQLAVIGGDVSSAAAPEPASAPAAKSHDVEDAPSAKKLMSEAGLSRDDVTATGKDNRVMKQDVQQAIVAAAAAPQAAPVPPATPIRAAVPADDAAREERVKMTRLRQTIARRLKDSQNTAAMLTTYNEVDMTEVMALRNEYKDLFLKKHGVKLGFMSFFTVPAAMRCARCLRSIRKLMARISCIKISSIWASLQARQPDWWCPLFATRILCHLPKSKRQLLKKAPARAMANCPWQKCRAAPSRSPTVESTAH